MTHPTPGALTRHDYRECPACTANRPRFCAQYYETENAILIAQVKDAIADHITPGGVKATYEQLLELCEQQRLALAQQAQEIERQKEMVEIAEWFLTLVSRANIGTKETPSLKAYIEQLEAKLAAMTAERDALLLENTNRRTTLGDLAHEMQTLNRKYAHLQATLAAREAELEQAERALCAKGYRRECDIPACNCGPRWIHGGHAESRLKEIDEALPWVNGKTILTRVNEMVEERDAAVQRAERAEARVREMEWKA